MYLILFIGIAILSYVVQSNLNSKFKKYSKIPIASGLSGREVAEKMLRDNGINNVTVTCTKGYLTDHYNPANGTVNLSEAVYNSRSVAAAAVSPRVRSCCAARRGIRAAHHAFGPGARGIVCFQLGAMGAACRHHIDTLHAGHTVGRCCVVCPHHIVQFHHPPRRD